MASIRTVAANITAVGSVTPWLRLDTWPFIVGEGILASFDFGLAATLTLDAVMDDLTTAMAHPVLVSQALTTITVKDEGPPMPQGQPNLGHGLAVGDYVELDGPAGVGGIYSVATVTDIHTYTLTSGTSQSFGPALLTARTGRVVNAALASQTALPSNLAAITGRQVAQGFTQFAALRLRCTLFTSAGVARLTVLLGNQSS